MTTTIPADDSATHVIRPLADDEPPTRRGALILFGASCAIAVAAGLGALFFGAPDPAPVETAITGAAACPRPPGRGDHQAQIFPGAFRALGTHPAQTRFELVILH